MSMYSGYGKIFNSKQVGKTRMDMTKSPYSHDVAYTFSNKDDSKTIVHKALLDVGIYLGANNLETIRDEINNEWVTKGYNVGQRKKKVKRIKKPLSEEKKINLDKRRLESINTFLYYRKMEHTGDKIEKLEYTKDEISLYNVGLYYRSKGLELPLRFVNSLILLGYYGLPLNITFDDNNEKIIEVDNYLGDNNERKVR